MKFYFVLSCVLCLFWLMEVKRLVFVFVGG